MKDPELFPKIVLNGLRSAKIYGRVSYRQYQAIHRRGIELPAGIWIGARPCKKSFRSR